MIDEKKLIEKVRSEMLLLHGKTSKECAEHIDLDDDAYIYIHGMEQYMKYKQWYIFLKHELENAPKVSEWTPVDERLPTEEDCEKQGHNCFLVTKLVGEKKYRVLDIVLIHTDYETWNVRETEQVIAWMQLPAQYTLQ